MRRSKRNRHNEVDAVYLEHAAWYDYNKKQEAV